MRRKVTPKVEKKERKRREPLSRDRIASTALALIDAHGLEELSTRQIGRALGCEAMAIYNHFASKDVLLDAVVDRIMRKEPRPVIMLSSLLREGSDLRALATERGAAACFNKNRIIAQAEEFIQTIKDVAYQRGGRADIPRLPLPALLR